MNKLLFDENVTSDNIEESIFELENEKLEASRMISDAVADISNAIKNNKDVIRDNIENGIGVINGSVQVKIFGYGFSVKYKIFSYRDFDLFFDKKNYFLNEYNSCASFKEKFIKLVVLSISGHIDERILNNSIFREIEQIYQNNVCENILLSDSSQYGAMFSTIKHKNAHKLDKILAQILYYTREEEYKPFVNYLYMELINSECRKPFIETIKQSDAYKIVNFLISSSKMLEDEKNNEELNELVKKYHRPKKWFINQSKATAMKIFKMIMDVENKASNDYFKINNCTYFCRIHPEEKSIEDFLKIFNENLENNLLWK